ncbi:MAG: DUF5895 domain-containing protein [Cyanobacteria bacterium P01_C01_bin.72]
MNSNNNNFGFDSEEYLGQLNTVPYCQFLNASSSKYGIAITSQNAELAELELIDSWSLIEHQFGDGTNETLFVTQEPKILVLNRSQPMMSNEVETIPYNKAKYTQGQGSYKAFSYLVVWFLNETNQPISNLPFRLRCSGFAGLTFLQNYDYYNCPNSFCKQFLGVYKSLTGDRAISKSNVFYAHAIYQPQFIRQRVTSGTNGQSSFAVTTESFTVPSNENFGQMIIRNGSPTSDRIKELIVSTKSWLKDEQHQFPVSTEEEQSPTI